jgi:hypothetical protein
LATFDLNDNPIISIPNGIIQAGAKDILQYLRQQRMGTHNNDKLKRNVK